MAYIRVDYSKFEKTASVIDSYLTSMKRKMASASSEVRMLGANWQGGDSAQFKTQWDKVTNQDSTYYHMLRSLESYEKYLKFAAKSYKDAQTKAIERANRLPK